MEAASRYIETSHAKEEKGELESEETETDALGTEGKRERKNNHSLTSWKRDGKQRLTEEKLKSNAMERENILTGRKLRCKKLTERKKNNVP